MWRKALPLKLKSYIDNHLNPAKANIIDPRKENFVQPLSILEKFKWYMIIAIEYCLYQR